MDFEWDERKAKLNLAKHGLPFDAAIEVFSDPRCLVISTARAEDGEERRRAIGLIEGRIAALIFVERGSVFRVVSARRADRKEERAYGQRDA